MGVHPNHVVESTLGFQPLISFVLLEQVKHSCVKKLISLRKLHSFSWWFILHF